jgi:DNA-directed RNA polymerase III subunit RPC2
MLILNPCSNLLIERLMLASDVALMDVCEKCGTFGYQGWCQLCRSSETIATVRMPYATKLLFTELLAMNINPRLEMKPQVS